VRCVIENRFGKRYRTLPILKALQLLYSTPQVHLSPKELVDLKTGAVFSTLGEHGELPENIDQVDVPVRPRRRPAKLRLHVPADRLPQGELPESAWEALDKPAAAEQPDADRAKRAA
jgi:hypothetical protein